MFCFFENASRMLRANGEVHVNHKTTPPFDNWNIEKLAMQNFLILIDCVDFNKEDYPGYNNKRGDSTRCDEPFPLGDCSTFKFIYNPRVQKEYLRRNDMEVSRQQTSLPFSKIRNLEQLPEAVDLNYYPRTSTFPKINEVVRPVFDLRNGYTPISIDCNNVNVNEIHGRVASSADLRNGYPPISRDYFNNVTEIHGRIASSADLGNGYPPTSRDYNNVKEIHGRVASSTDLGNGYTPISKDYFNNVTEMHRRVDSSADCYYPDRYKILDSRRTLQPMELLQPLQLWPASSNCRFSTTNSFRRTMDIWPSLSVSARNEDYKYQVFGGKSRYLQEELCKTAAERPSYCSEFDRQRTDFERYIADGARKTYNSGNYVVQ